jgi:hypothetical protein
VIVGGAAVSFYTQGLILSGDFNLVAATALEPFLLAEGFLIEDRPGRLRRGYYHPKTPRYGFELVSGALFDGRCDTARMQVFRLAAEADVTLPPVEDLIADRLGQFAASNNRDREMVDQARLLLKLARDIDRDYLGVGS